MSDEWWPDHGSYNPCQCYACTFGEVPTKKPIEEIASLRAALEAEMKRADESINALGRELAAEKAAREKAEIERGEARYFLGTDLREAMDRVLTLELELAAERQRADGNYEEFQKANSEVVTWRQRAEKAEAEYNTEVSDHRETCNDLLALRAEVERLKESAGFWGRATSKMQSERDEARAKVAELETRYARAVEHDEESYAKWKTARRDALEEAAKYFEDESRIDRWLCLDHGGDEGEEIARRIRTLAKEEK